MNPRNLFKCFDCVGYKKRKRFVPTGRGGHRFCVWPTYGGGCHRWWDHDPASDPKGLKALKDELVSYAEAHGAKAVSEMVAANAAKMKGLEKATWKKVEKRSVGPALRDMFQLGFGCGRLFDSGMRREGFQFKRGGLRVELCLPNGCAGVGTG